MSTRRRLFYTGSGFVGLGPAIIQPGDVACVMGGLIWPAIFRPKDRSKEQFRFVGHAYVAGAMHWAVMDRIVEGSLLESYTRSFHVI
jgi:hypothetical protein